MKRKTYTSPEIKNKWNREHYDRLQITVPIGARDEIQRIAEKKGMSVAAYVRHLIISDNNENPENTRFLRGGGVYDYYSEMICKDVLSAADSFRAICDGQDPGQLPLVR